jgi:dolichol-phosphate mannosyltransferase
LKKIAVVIPAFRAERKIQSVIANIPSSVQYIIVINDCSPDETLLKLMAIDDPRLHIISHNSNQGVGGAMLTGYSYALHLDADIIVKIDSDGQMDPEKIPELIYSLDNSYADFAKGNRFLHQEALKKMPPIRFIGNLALTFLSKLASGYWNIFDPTNGFTAITKNLLTQMNPYRMSRDYFFETSMICEMRSLDAVIVDVAIPAVYEDEESSINISREFFVFLRNIFQRAKRRFLYQYFVYDFSAGSVYFCISGVLGLFGLIWGIVMWVKSANSGLAASTGTVLLAVLPIIIATQLLLQAMALDIESVPHKNYNMPSKKQYIINKESQMYAYIKKEKDSNKLIIIKGIDL